MGSKLSRKYRKEKINFISQQGFNEGSYLIDDRDANGVLDFEGEHIKFGQENLKIGQVC